MAALVVGVLLVGVVYGLPLLRKPDFDALANTALTADSEKDRIEATQELSRLGLPSVSALRTVLDGSNDEKVVAVCLLALARQQDYPSMEKIIAKLDDPTVNVRTAAAKATSKLLGRNHHFPVAGTERERQRIKEQIEEDWKQYNGSPLFKKNVERFNEQSKE